MIWTLCRMEGTRSSRRVSHGTAGSDRSSLVVIDSGTQHRLIQRVTIKGERPYGSQV
jgi:hypothetical protein